MTWSKLTALALAASVLIALGCGAEPCEPLCSADAGTSRAPSCGEACALEHHGDVEAIDACIRGRCGGG